MRVSIPNKVLVYNCTVLTPSRHLNAQRDTHSKEPIYHRRIGSITLKTRSNATINDSQNLITKNGGMKRSLHGRIKTEKHTPMVSPKIFNIKAMDTKEIYTSKLLCKSTSQHPKLNNITALKSGRSIIRARHGSIGSQLPIKIQNESFSGTTTIRQRRNTLKFLKDTDDFRNTMQRGLESLQHRNLKLAIEHFTRAIDLKENVPEAYFNRGVAYFEFEDMTKALRDFEKVAEEWPNYNKSTYLYLSMIYTRIGDTNYALSSVSLLLIL